MQHHPGLFDLFLLMRNSDTERTLCVLPMARCFSSAVWLIQRRLRVFPHTATEYALVVADNLDGFGFRGNRQYEWPRLRLIFLYCSSRLAAGDYDEAFLRTCLLLLPATLARHLLSLPHAQMRAQMRLVMCSCALVAQRVAAPRHASPMQVPCGIVCAVLSLFYLH